MRAVIEKIILIPEIGDPINIKDITVELNVYQNLFEHYMHCDLVVTDSFDLNTLIPQDVERWISGGFAGTEILLIQYYPDGGTGPLVSNAFFLFERSAKKQIKQNMDAYILSGVSMESYQSFPKRISQAYGGSSGNTIDKMIKSITDKFLYNSEIKDIYNHIKLQTGTLIDKNNVYEESIGLHKFVIPNLSVDDTIEFLCNEADSESHIPQFLFYEDYFGFNFRNLETLVKRAPKHRFVKEESVTRANSLEKPMDKIISYDVVSESNILQKAREGLFKSKLINIDVLQKKHTTLLYDYSKQKSKFQTLQKFAHRGNVPDHNVNVTMLTSRLGHDSNALFSLEKHKPKRINQFLPLRKSYTKHIFNTTMRVTVPGTTGLNVGDTVYLDFPVNDGLTDNKTKSDIQLSGKYIVTKVRNKMNNPGTSSSFETIFECVKDTQIEIV